MSEPLGTGTFMKMIENEAAQALVSRSLTVATAESCTGGLIAFRLTSISGSSAFFDRGAVTYSNRSKMEMLHVPRQVVEKHGAVSEETARAMAEGIRKQSKTDIGLSVTGIAGPTGGTPEKPVGTVYIALSLDKKTECRRYLFQGDRETVRRKTSDTALEWIRDCCLKEMP